MIFSPFLTHFPNVCDKKLFNKKFSWVWHNNKIQKKLMIQLQKKPRPDRRKDGKPERPIDPNS